MIYFMLAEISGHVKIGKANDPIKRLAQLRTGSHEPLTLLGAIPGGVAEERRLHERFAVYRVRGEWFRGDEALMAEIRAILSPPPEVKPLFTPPPLTEDGAIICPCCGFDYASFTAPVFVPVGAKEDINWGPRGNLIVVKFYGECGSEWEFCLGFHKGRTSNFIRINKACRD